MWYDFPQRGKMAKIDRLKELIGYLKVVLSILVAIDVSIIAWIYQHTKANLILPFVVVVLITFAIIVINKKILSKIDELEDL